MTSWTYGNDPRLNPMYLKTYPPMPYPSTATLPARTPFPASTPTFNSQPPSALPPGPTPQPQPPSSTSYPPPPPPTKPTARILLQNINCVLQPTATSGGLFIGNIIAIILPEYLAHNHIRAILSCSDNAVFEASECPYKGVEQSKVIKARDIASFQLSEYFDECYQWIDQQLRANRNTLVHCHAGVSRSATVVIAYLMRRNGWGMDQAYQFLKDRRNCIKPNTGFMMQLRDYSQKLRKTGGLAGAVQQNTNVKQQVQIGNLQQQQPQAHQQVVVQQTNILTPQNNTQNLPVQIPSTFPQNPNLNQQNPSYLQKLASQNNSFISGSQIKLPERSQSQNIIKSLIYTNLGGICSFDDDDLQRLDSQLGLTVTPY